MLPMLALLVLAAFIITMLNAIGKAPLWVAVLLLVIIHMLALQSLR